MKRRFKYLFGPVPSRRFGLSLGVDLTPFKTCTLNCVFCQLGRTTNQTTKRKEYVSAGAVKAELADWLDSGGKANYITLAGSGEPTLHSHFGDIIDFIHKYSKIPVALLTNGTTLHLPEVRKSARKADVVKVTLNSSDQKLFEYIHRPYPSITYDLLIKGLLRFRAECKSQIWLEVFLLGGVNATPEEARKISRIVAKIKPDRVQLNTCVRPTAEDFAYAISRRKLFELARLFKPNAEVIAEYKGPGTGAFHAGAEDILNMLRRRPCTAAQIAEVSGMHLNEVSKYTGKLTRVGQVRVSHEGGVAFYSAARKKTK